MPGDLAWRLETGERLRRLARDLRQLEDGKGILRDMRKQLRQIAQSEMVPAVRAAARRIPSKGESTRRGRRPLRESLARATQARVKTAGRSAGVMVWISPRRMPPGQHTLPAYVEGFPPFNRWRHPLFGNADYWYQQRSHPFFYRTLRPYRDRAERAMEEVLDAAAARLIDD